jgi:signal recognition particle subunit SEC65
LKHLAPEYKEAYRFSRQVYGRLADIVASKSEYYNNVMQNFMRELNVGHMEREWLNPKDKYNFLKRVVVERRGTIESKISQAKAQLRKVLEQAQKAGTKEQVEEVQELINKLDGFKDEALEKLFGKRGNFIDFMDEMRQTGEKIGHPGMKAAYRDFERIIGKSFGEMRTVAGTIEGIEALGREAGFKKLLETNIAKLLYAEETKLKSVLLYHSYIKRMQTEFPDLIKVAKRGAAAPEGAVKVSSPIMGAFFVHKDIADMFGNIMKVGSGKGDPLIDVAKYFDRFYSSMKYYMIVPFAKTGIRNFVSSVSLTSLSLKPGEVPAYMSSLYRATKLWNKAKRGDKAAMGMYQKMMRGGLLETFYRAEFAMGTKGLTPKYPNFGLGGVGRAIEGTKVGGAAAKVATPAFRTAMGGMATFYESTEMIPRMAMYLFAKDKPAAWFHRFGVKNVIDYVRKFQPSYSKLTPFERKYMNRIFMFYSWPRHNIPLHIEMIINNPGHYANLEKLRRAGTEILGGELPEYFEPEYIRKGYAVGLKGHGANKKTYFLLRGWAPEADLESVMSIQSFRDLFSGMFNPMVKTPLEVGYGYDMFKKKKLPAYPGEKVPFYGMQVDPRIPHMLSFMRAVQETNRFWFNRTDPFMTRCMYALLGKTYTVDVEKARRYFKYHGGVVIGEIDHGIERAKKERDFDTVKRLTAQKHKIEQSLKGL